jgi:hypothetical protein
MPHPVVPFRKHPTSMFTFAVPCSEGFHLSGAALTVWTCLEQFGEFISATNSEPEAAVADG